MAINLKIDFKKLKLPKAVRIALAVVPAIIIIAVTVLFIVMPKTKEIRKLQTEITSQENEIAKSKAMAAKLDVLKIENDKLKKRLEELKKQLPEEKEISSLLKQISEIAMRSDVDVLTWKPEAKKPHPSGIVEEMPWSLTIAGTYHKLGVFFSNLTRLDRIVNLSDIKLGGPKVQKDEAMLDISFKASTFSAVKEEEKVPDKKGKGGK